MAQPNFAAIGAHLQVLGNEVSLVPNMPAVAGLGALQEQINANHQQLVALIGQVQGQIGQMQDQMAQIQSEQQLLPMRLHNASASDTAPFRYPGGIPEGNPLPQTSRDLIGFTADQCQAASAALGLPALPPDAMVEERRQQIAQYLGVAY